MATLTANLVGLPRFSLWLAEHFLATAEEPPVTDFLIPRTGPIMGLRESVMNLAADAVLVTPCLPWITPAQAISGV